MIKTKKYTVNLPIPLLNRIKDIPCPFIKGENMNNRVMNAFLYALSKKGSTAKDCYYLATTYEERTAGSRLETFRLPQWLFEMVKEKHIDRCKECKKLKIPKEDCEDDCLKSIYNHGVFMYSLSLALIKPPNLDYVSPAYHLVGQKNDKMCTKTKMILGKKFYRERQLYIEPFCGSAALFLSLPLQPTWKYILNDLNKNRVNLLRAIKHHHLELMEKVCELEYKPDKYEGKNNETRQALTAKIECFGNYHRYPDWFGTQAKKIEAEKNPFKHQYAKEKDKLLSPTDNPRGKYYCYIDIAAEFLIYESITFRRKLSAQKFTENLAQIPLISAKLNQAKAKILWGDGVEIVRKYGMPNTLKEYTGYKPLLVIDPPYIGTEEQCDVDDLKKSHSKLANFIYRCSEHSLFLYYCRSTCPIRYIGKDRIEKDIVLKGIIDDYFRGRGYHYEEYQLLNTKSMKIKEFMVTNFKHHYSAPYTRIATKKRIRKPPVKK